MSKKGDTGAACICALLMGLRSENWKLRLLVRASRHARAPQNGGIAFP
jgi:hypothetical protein